MKATQKKDARQSMNRMYKLTRHVYDTSRKFYLLGRDKLIEMLDTGPNEHVIEVGCGTARNLIKMQDTYPHTYFYGVDASDEMLKTARQALLREQLADQIPLGQGLAQTFSPLELFGLEVRPDKIVFSYVLSMIPDAPAAVDHALKLLPPGGEVHIIDFDDLSGQNPFFRETLKQWLSLFHVRHDPELLEYYKLLERQGKCTRTHQSLYGNYAYRTVLRKI